MGADRVPLGASADRYGGPDARGTTHHLTCRPGASSGFTPISNPAVFPFRPGCQTVIQNDEEESMGRQTAKYFHTVLSCE
jgi:hypothetical protein